MAVLTVTVLVTVGLLEAADLWWRRDQALQQAASRATNLSVVLAEYVRSSFVSADAALRQIAVHAGPAGGPSAPHQVWDPILAAARSALPEVGSFTITDRNGTITHSTVKTIVGASRRDNYVFRRLASGDRDELVVDRPFLSLTPPRQYLIPIGRRLVDPSGHFDGAVVVTLLPESYRDFFRTLDLGPGGTITVLHPEGVVLFLEPSAGGAINEPASDSPLLEHARASGNGTFEGPMRRGGPGYVNAFRTIASPPLIVSVSLLTSDVLAGWYRQRRVSAIAYAVFALTLCSILLALFRVAGARERAERELDEVQRQEAERLRVANERLAQALDREQQARRHVEEASSMKDEFLMTVSHELRTPLTAIYGWVRVLATRDMPRGEQARALAAIERNALAQTRLIDDLLDVSRAIAGKLRLEVHEVDLAAAIRGAVETLTPAATAKRLQIHVAVDDGLDPVPADPDRLQQIVWNLLSNAIKFTPEGGRIDVRARRAGEARIELAVSDNGVGIPADFLPFVFDRFRQADAGTRRRYGGLGLGLAIVRHLVELHGGTVSVESGGEGAGTTFRVAFPAPASLAPGRTRSAPAGDPTAAAGLRGVRVLVVDDEQDSRELFAQVLEAAGAEVTTAASAGDALAHLGGGGISVVVSDVEMPDMDGYQLLRLVRADPRLQQPRVVAIALTAYAGADDRRRALEAGFDEHLAKPVDPSALVTIVGKLLNAC